MKSKIKRAMELKPSQRTLGSVALIALGALLVFSGVGKLISPPVLENIWPAQLVGGWLTGVLWVVLPFVEIAVGIALIARLKVRWVAWVVMGLVLNFIINNVWLISIGKGFESCGQCLGWGIDIWPIGSIYIDLVMLGLLLFGCKSYENARREIKYVG